MEPLARDPAPSAPALCWAPRLLSGVVDPLWPWALRAWLRGCLPLLRPRSLGAGQQPCVLTVPEAGSPGSGDRPILFLVRTLLPVWRRPPARCVLTRRGGSRLWSLLRRALMPAGGPCPRVPRTPSPQHHVGVGIQRRGSWTRSSAHSRG